MARLEEIIDRYHMNAKSADFIVRKMFKTEHKNQLVRDFFWLVNTLRKLSKEINK